MREIKKISAPPEKAYTQYDLAKSYEHGAGVKKNKSEAVRYYILAANQGHMGAQKRLGYLYQHGIGVDQNESEAIDWYTKAAQQGNITAHEQLIALYLKKDEQRSFYWTIRMLAQQGRAPSQYRLGCYYARGKFVEKDYTAAMSWWKKAAEQRNVAAQYCLAQFFLILAELNNRSQNLSIALYWFQQMEFEHSLVEVAKLKQQGIIAIEKAESGFFPVDLKSVEVKNLSTLFHQAKELYFAKKKADKEQKYKISACETSTKVQEFIQYHLQTASRIPDAFEFHNDHFKNEGNTGPDDKEPADPSQKKSLLEKIAAEFPKNIVKCRIPVPLDFAQYEDAIIEVPADYQGGAPLLKDISRNQCPTQLLLLDSTVIEDGVIEESGKLNSLINNVRGDFIRNQKALIAQKAALMSAVSNSLEEGMEIDMISQKIDKIQKQIKDTVTQKIEIVDKILTRSLADEKSPFSMFAQRLSLTWAKQAICCFDQQVMYIYKFLQHLIVYLENQKSENRHKNICYALINFMKMVTNIYVEEDRYDLTLMLIKSESDIKKILDENKELHQKPILFKEGDKFSIYGLSPEWKWQLTKDLSADKLVELKFEEKPKILSSSQVPKKVYEEITLKKGHTQEDKLIFSSYLKGIHYQCLGAEDISPGIEKQMPDCEIRVDYRLMAQGGNATLVPQIYTSDIKLAKQFFEAFCASQIDKIENKMSVSPLTQSFSDFSRTLRGEKKIENRGLGMSVKKFLLEVYRVMVKELPKDLDFEVHLAKMARLSALHESGHQYLAACYLKKMGFITDLNPEQNSLDDLFQLYQKIKSGENIMSDRCSIQLKTNRG